MEAQVRQYLGPVYLSTTGLTCSPTFVKLKAKTISIKKAGFNINYLETAALHLFVTGSFAVTIDKERAQDESD